MAVDILTDVLTPVNMSGVKLITQIEECCVSVLEAQAGQEACVCNLTAPVGLSQPTVSHHLKLLNEAGVLDREQRGRWVYYSIRPGALDRVASVFSMGGA